jgi:hypothetical protein
MNGKILPFQTKLSQAADMIGDIGEYFSESPQLAVSDSWFGNAVLVFRLISYWRRLILATELEIRYDYDLNIRKIPMGIVRLFAVSLVALILTTGTAYPSRLSIPEAEKQAQVMRDTAYAKAAELRELRKTLHSWWGAQETVNRLQALYYKIATIKYLKSQLSL